MSKIQYFGIKYPFEAQGEEQFFVDLNVNMREKIRGQLMHIIFTPKGSRLRAPEFGTDLIRYIFEMNDATTWGNVLNEIKSAVSAFIPDVTIKDVNVLKNEENETEIYVRIDYTVSQGNKAVDDTVITKI